MKKLLIVLFSAICGLALATDPWLSKPIAPTYFQTCVKVKDSIQAPIYFQVKDTLATKGYARLQKTDTTVFVRKAGAQTITGLKTFSTGLISSGVQSSAGGLFYGQTSPFPTGLGTYVANYVSPTYGARILAYNGSAYQPLCIGKLISGSTFQLALNSDGTSVFGGTVTATNLSGTNTGDETNSTIISKLGFTPENSSKKGAANGYAPLGNNAQISDSYIPSNIARMTDINNGNVIAAIGYNPENVDKKGVANGYTPLDASAKIATTYLPAAILGALKYQGTWAASVGAYPASPAQGNYWVISTAGTLGTTAYKVGDWLTYNGSSWDKIDNSQTVSSVFGRTGAVVATTGDYTSDQITEGTTNKYYTDARARASLSFAAGSGAYNSSTGVITIPTNNNQLTNGAGYALATGTNATGTWPVSISGTAANATTWGSQSYTSIPSTLNYVMGYNDASSKWSYYSLSQTQTWLGISGASGYIPKFGSGNTLSNSTIFETPTTPYGTVQATLKIEPTITAGTSTNPTSNGSIKLSGGGYDWGGIYTIQPNPAGSWYNRMAFLTMNGNGGALIERMCLDNQGKVGIGTDAPDNGKLTILKNTTYNTEASYALSIQSNIGNAYTELQIGADDAINCGVIQTAGKFTSWISKSLVLNPNGGAVGIGNTSPQYALDVTGSIRSTGIMYAPNFQTTSDVRLKTKIKPISLKQLPINYYSFYLKSDTTDLRYGVIAQEVQKVAPELVSKGKDGYLSVKYTDLLVKEIAALKEIIKTQEERISKIEKLISK